MTDSTDAQRDVEYEVWQKDAFGDGDVIVAGPTSLPDAQHYAMMYGQDGPAWVVEVTRRPITASSATPPSAAIMRQRCAELLNGFAAEEVRAIRYAETPDEKGKLRVLAAEFSRAAKAIRRLPLDGREAVAIALLGQKT